VVGGYSTLASIFALMRIKCSWRHCITIYNVPTILLCIICSVFISGSKNWHRHLTYYITHFYVLYRYRCLLTYLLLFRLFRFRIYSTKSAVSPPHVIIMVHAYSSILLGTTGSPRIDINLNTVWHKCLLVTCVKIQTIRSKRWFRGWDDFHIYTVFSKNFGTRI